MTDSRPSPWLHRLAVLTVCVALVPILLGALVTTKDAGMAFPDWPSSDGHNMLFYPWLKSAGAKFLEHAHRLAGITIGLTSIILVIVAHQTEPRAWVRRLAYAVLAAVIAQGILGGQRVLLDERQLAFVHGSFAALVLALMAGLAVVTSQGWFHASIRDERAPRHRLRILALATCGCVFVQYVLGGLLRHRGMVLYEHLGFAFVAALMTVWLAISAAASGISWLRGPAALLALLTIVQLGLGAGAWVTKFGFGGYVAVYGSLVQDVVRTSHVLCGMMLFVTSVVLTVRIARMEWLSPGTRGSSSAHRAFEGGMHPAGGAP
jgi:cytochrome c oxidase assembly protein subunit 15